MSVRAIFAGRFAGIGRAFGLGSMQALIRLACSFISIKLTAVYLGPGGLALVAQFNNLVTLGQGLLNSGNETAIVRMTAECQNDAEARRTHWSSAMALCLGLALGGLLLLTLAGPLLASRLLTDASYAWAIVLAGLTIAVCMVNNVLLGALNGVREIRLVVRANIVSAIAGLLVFAPACMLWGAVGGFIGAALSLSLALCVTVYHLRHSKFVTLREFFGRPRQASLRLIASFYPMLVAHAVMTPLATIAVRDSVIDQLGLTVAGIWQGAFRLSDVCTGIVTTSLSLYFMPRLGELIRQPQALSREIWRTMGTAVGVTAVLALRMFVLRDTVVRLVLSSAFDGVQDLLPIQLLGDVVKMAAWTLGFVLVALVRTRWYLLVEVLTPVLFVALVHLLTPAMGVVGATWAYLAAYAVKLLLAAVALRDLLFHSSAPHEAGQSH